MTFEGVMDDFRKNIAQTDFERKKHANKFLGEKYPALKKISLTTYNAEKKNLTPLYVGEKISNSREVWEKILSTKTESVKSPIPHCPTNVQWKCPPFRGWGKKRN